MTPISEPIEVVKAAENGMTWDEFLATRPFRPWYRFGLRSPEILFKRLRNKYRPVIRLRYAWQRARRGHDDMQLWNLNWTVATLIVEGVRRLREDKLGYPTQFCDPAEVPEFVGALGGGWEAWDDVLRRIEEGFQAWLDEDGHFYDKPDQEDKFEEAMILLGHWFGSLWD